MTDFILNFFLQTGLTETTARAFSYGSISMLIMLVTILATWIVRNVLLKSIVHFIQQNNYQWDDALIENKFFNRISWFIPVVILYLTQDLLLP